MPGMQSRNGKKNKRYKGRTGQNKYLPAFGRRILFDEKGRIWIEQLKEKDQMESIYDIFSKNFIYIKKVTSPYTIYRFKNNKLFGISTTEDGEWIIKCSGIISGFD